MDKTFLIRWYGHRQIQHRAAKGGADGLTGLGGMALPVEGILTPEALKIGIVPVGVHRVLLSGFLGCFAPAARGKLRPAGRDTFGHGLKSVQKGRLNLRFKNPRTLCPL